MSLINDALKKAQAERPSSPTHHPGMPGGPGQPPQKPRRKRRYLFGFIMAVLIVGLFSTGISTYLVYEILGSGDKPAEAQPVKPETAKPEAQPPADQAPGVEMPPIEETLPTQPVEIVESEPEETPVSEVSKAVDNPVPTVAESEPPTPFSVPEPVVTVDPNGYPEVWVRLEDFEIRGVMAGGSRLPKALIFDARTQKARSYVAGELIDRALSLKVASISAGVIYFENNDGAQFSKAF